MEVGQLLRAILNNSRFPEAPAKVSQPRCERILMEFPSRVKLNFDGERTCETGQNLKFVHMEVRNTYLSGITFQFYSPEAREIVNVFARPSDPDN